MHNFEGIWVPIVTPYRNDAIDHAALARLARRLADAQVAGIVTGATTGEGFALSLDERMAVVATLRHALGPDYPVVIGVSGSDTRSVAAEAKQMAALKPVTLLVTAPPYVRPSQAGLMRHFETIAEAASMPLMLYNIPYRAGVDIEFSTARQLAGSGCAVAVKECGTGLERINQLVQHTALQVLAGDDPQVFPALCAGAAGGVTASANLCPAEFVQLCRLVREQKLDEARRLASALQPVIAALFAEPNPAPLKAALSGMALMEDGLRLPLLPASEATRKALREACRALPPGGH